VLVPFPVTTCRRAPPLLIALDQPEEQDRRHKTSSQLLRQMLRVLSRWYPGRTFVCTAGDTYPSHDLAESASRSPRRPTFVSRFDPNANRVASPPPSAGAGRPRVKGDELPSPTEVVQGTATRHGLEVAWSGGGRRRVAVATGRGCRHQGGKPYGPGALGRSGSRR
jgi:hypothetical protein